MKCHGVKLNSDIPKPYKQSWTGQGAYTVTTNHTIVYYQLLSKPIVGKSVSSPVHIIFSFTYSRMRN